jgi:uncharacterized protein (DUF2132 family)
MAQFMLDTKSDQLPSDLQPKNPLHGVTLEQIVTRLHERLGWQGLAQCVNINCFKSDPSVKSSLKFLRKTPWARTEVEQLYVAVFTRP